MRKQTKAGKPVSDLASTDSTGYSLLEELALDMRWSWSQYADEVWKQLDPNLWELTHNPWIVLQTMSRTKIQQLFSDPQFRTKLEALVAARREAADAPAWFQQSYPKSALTTVAYFSMEYMLSEALPIYSGGLGNVAGDQLKAASDLGVPVVAVGLLYQQGYFRQTINRDGAQEALYPYNDPGQLPISPVRKPDGEWLRLEIPFPGYSIWLRIWQVQVGGCKLYLLDSNDAANYPAHRSITSELYGGGPELRLQQELALGIGGWRLLEALDIHPEVCHLNEGHAGFLVLERARSFMTQTGQPFEVALASTRAGNLFTTHTAVAAGFDRFPPALIEQYLTHYAQQLGIRVTDLLAFGRQNPNNAAESFNMAFLALRGSAAVNGVSQLHGQVSRSLFAPLFPRWPGAEVPVGHVTNGIHIPTWESAEADALWTSVTGKERWERNAEMLKQEMQSASEETIWQMRTDARKLLVEHARERLAAQRAVAGASLEEIDAAKHLFDPNILTMGFARRFATYKRPNLLLKDPARLLRLLTRSDRPVQLILAGKAHPADRPGQDLIRQWTHFLQIPEARAHVIFLSDYDMLLTERLVQGADVWLNTPRRPWEACGTSGMKVLVNGGINVSELDGWWAEAYTPEVGWALGDRQEHGGDPGVDAAEADALYTLLETEVIPEFYTRDARGISPAWVARVRNSMAQLTPQYSANRAVRQYTEQYYLPAATEYRRRIADKGAVGQQMVAWRHNLQQQWGAIHFGEVKVTEENGKHVFDVQVFLGDLPPDAIRVELYADSPNADGTVRQTMTPAEQTTGGHVYRAAVSASRPASEYTPRIIPDYCGVAVPIEAQEILWQH